VYLKTAHRSGAKISRTEVKDEGQEATTSLRVLATTSLYIKIVHSRNAASAFGV
jgi:hypothetical protein